MVEFLIQFPRTCFFIEQYENRRVQEFTCPDYTKVYFLKPEEQINTEEWLQLKKGEDRLHAVLWG